MGFFAGLNTEKYDRQYSDRELVGRIVEYFHSQRKRILGIVVMVLMMSLTGAALPWVVSRGLDMLGGQPTEWGMIAIGLVVLGIGLINWFANWARQKLTARAVGDVVVNLRTAAFQAAANHDLSFYDNYSSGRILSRITNDTQDFGQLIVLVTDLVSQFVESGILAVVLVNIEWKLSLFLFALMPISFLLALAFRGLARNITRKGFQAMANVNATIKETVSGIAVAKNFRQEQGIYQDFDDANQTSYRVNVRRGLVLSIVWPTLNALSGIATGVMVYFGGLSAAQGAVTVGAWYLFVQSQDRFLYPVMNLAAFWTQVQNGLSASERIFALIDAKPAVVQTDQLPVKELRGEVKFEHVDFSYKDGTPVLEDFNLCIRPGENIALVGHTGAGKSSIGRLIARFYEFQHGKLLIDGKDIRTLDLKAYRQHLGVVSQTPFLFSGTVLENICYAIPEISRSEVESIARQIGNGEWIDTLPNGLDSEVGERGAQLSMGQRQLVSLMRVLVQRPKIFILDEATASIDPFTEWQIQQALKLILSKTTSILIAHRLSTVRSADRILVMENGKVIEEGNHEGLLVQGGHYATLYNTYFRHQSLAYVEQSRRMATDSN
ncbi:MAG: ABC transporter ATP-binding protein [Anaerolineaceae bacterium]